MKDFFKYKSLHVNTNHFITTQSCLPVSTAVTRRIGLIANSFLPGCWEGDRPNNQRGPEEI